MTLLPHQGSALPQDDQACDAQVCDAQMYGAPAYASLLDQIVQRRLDGMALLWLNGHQPLAFIAGQLCWLIAPLALLCGWSQVETWAAALSAPHSGAHLVRDLHQARVHHRQVASTTPAHDFPTSRLPNGPQAQHKE